MGRHITRDAQLLKFFAQQYSGIPRKRLVKMAYLADLISRQYLGHPITTFEYRVNHFGPYSPAIEDAVKELVSKDLALTRDSQPDEDGQDAWKLLFDVGKRVVFDFSLGENEVLAYVADNYLDMSMDELLEDVVYPTAPFQAVRNEFRARIPMELVNGQEKQFVGFDLEAVIKAEQQAELGGYATAREFFDGLRARYTA